MAENIYFDKKEESSFRDYLEIIYKRRMVFVILFLLIFGMGTFRVLFMTRLIYKSSATVMVGTPAVQVMTQDRWMIRERYVAQDELELIGSNIIAKKASELLKESREYEFELSADEIMGMIQVTEKPRSRIINISAESTVPKKAYLAVKSVIEAYIKETEERRDKIIKGAYESLNKQLAEKHKELEDAERALTKFVIEHDIIARGIEAGKEIEEEEKLRGRAAKKEPEINEKYLALKSERINKEAFLEEVKNHRKKDPVTTLSIIAKREEALVDLSLRDELYEKEMKLSKLLLNQSELHPDVIEARGEVTEAKKKISLELNRAIQSLELSINTLKREEEKLRTLIKEGLSEKMVQYSALKRDIEVKKNIYDSFVNQLNELDVSDKLQKVPFLQIVKAPAIPKAPINPKSKSLLVALLTALFTTCGITILLEYADVSIKDVEEVEDILNLNVLATITTLKKPLDDKMIKEGIRGRYYLGLIALNHPKSTISEAFRTLRTNIKFVGVDKKLKSILVTSVGPQEGKSTIASNLAVTMARAGEKVILIDGDLRKSTLHKHFNMNNSKGLSNILVGEESIEEAKINDTEVESLKVLTSGPKPPNPNEILGTARMDELLSKLNEQFNMAIMDSPPVLTVSDALILAAKTDGVILVFLANKTAKKAGKRAHLLLKNTGAKILGGVLNGVDVGKRGYYYYYDYAYYSDEKETKD